MARHRWLALCCAAAIVSVGCSGDTGSATPSTVQDTVAATTTTLLPSTPTFVEGSEDPQTSSTTSTSAPVVVVGLPTSVVFPAIEVIDPTLSLRSLARGDLDRLDARFRQDERVDVFLEDVDARGVYQDDQLVAVAVAVAVSPGAASTAGFIESFIDGATAGGTVNPAPVTILDQELVSWLAADTGHLLWSFENLFLIVSGRDPIQVRDIASAVVTMVIAPPPPPELVVCPEPDAEVDPDADPEAVVPEECIAADHDDG